jgi:hypothetical protein
MYSTVTCQQSETLQYVLGIINAQAVITFLETWCRMWEIFIFFDVAPCNPLEVYGRSSSPPSFTVECITVEGTEQDWISVAALPPLFWMYLVRFSLEEWWLFRLKYPVKLDSKGLWLWRMTHGITTFFGLRPSSGILKKTQRFRKINDWGTKHNLYPHLRVLTNPVSETCSVVFLEYRTNKAQKRSNSE